MALAKSELARRMRGRKFYSYYPDSGPLSRDKYPKHMAFFAAGVSHRERAFCAANRVGKTEGVGLVELTCHLTGEYPTWWEGRRFTHPVSAIMAGKTNETTRDILQGKMFGPVVYDGGPKKRLAGTGVLPADSIDQSNITFKGGTKLLDTVRIRHVSGGYSTLGVKSYEQGRGAFEGVERHVILLDEEPPAEIYTECVVRTMTTDGLVMLTFTPLEGLSDVVLLYMPSGEAPDNTVDNTVDNTAAGGSGRFIINATWDDAPHLTSDAKAELWASVPPHERDARSKGIPQLGSGKIYPIAEDDILIDDFIPPPYFTRAYGLDFGWRATAAVWGAYDRERDILYLTSEYKRGQTEPSVHADAIRSRGAWIPGVCDPAGRISNQKDGDNLLDAYIDLGLNLIPANNAREAGIFEVYKRLTTGRLKVFKSCAGWLAEFRIYRRDEKGRVVKENDHLMDSTRYLVMSGIPAAIESPIPSTKEDLMRSLSLYKSKNGGDEYDEYEPLTFGLEVH
jgi:phage terminase large subunit-like protein